MTKETVTSAPFVLFTLVRSIIICEMNELCPGSTGAQFIWAPVDSIVSFDPIVISYLNEGISEKGRAMGFFQTKRMKVDWKGPIYSGVFEMLVN